MSTSSTSLSSKPSRPLWQKVVGGLAVIVALAVIGFLAGPRNAFGPVAAYRLGEIRFNVRHRTLRRLAKEPSPELAARALLPVLAHELAHVCHELHDLDFYRTSRALLRALVVAAAKVDARRLSGPRDGPAGDAPTEALRLGR